MTLDIAARVHVLTRNSVAVKKLARFRRRADDYVRDFIPDTAEPGERSVLARVLYDAARQLHARECGALATECREAAGAGTR